MTITNYDGHRLCGHTETEQALGVGQKLSQWPHSELTWSIRDGLPGIAEDSYAAIVGESFKRWTDVCGLRTRRVVSGRGNIEFTVQTIGPGGVLADCQLPYPGITPSHTLLCRVDTAENWVAANNPQPNQIDLYRVLCHELGHGIGISHLPENSGALMAPFYSAKIAVPQVPDIEQARARYGARVVAQQPDKNVPPMPAGGEQLLLGLFARGNQLVMKNAEGGELVLYRAPANITLG